MQGLRRRGDAVAAAVGGDARGGRVGAHPGVAARPAVDGEQLAEWPALPAAVPGERGVTPLNTENPTRQAKA